MTLMAQDRPLPTPPVYPDNTEFWAAANEGRLLVPKCGSCGKTHWYPRPFCPHCRSDDVSWIEASGKGTIYSVSPTRRVPVPYAIAYVTLDEGTTMLTNIVDTDLDQVKIGDRVQVVFKATEGGQKVPMFKPA